MPRIAANRDRLTDARARAFACPPGQSESLLFDTECPGLLLRCRANGSKTWMVRLTLNGERRRHTIGEVGAVKIEVARSEARRIIGEGATGRDAIAAKAAIKAAATVGEIIDGYIEHMEGRLAAGTLRRNTVLDSKRHLTVLAKPLRHEKIVTRAMVARLIDKVRQGDGKPRPVEAERLRSTLSAMYAWAIHTGRFEGNNPVVGIKPQPVVKRDRVLSDEEIRWFWQATDDGSDASRVLRLMLLTGQRETEVGGMRWSEIANGEPVVWRLPAARAKNRRAHEVPLLPLALAQLPERPSKLHDAAGVERPIFGRTKATDSRRKRPDIKVRTTGRTGFAGWSKAKARLDERMGDLARAAWRERYGREPEAGEAIIPPWRLHDLRRTAATRMNEHGVDLYIVEVLLNHVSGSRRGVVGVYNHASYATQKRDALELYEGLIRSIVGNQ